jgi:hypothetical protein
VTTGQGWRAGSCSSRTATHVGVVKLDEGVQLLARLHPSPETGDWDGYACDQRVRFAPVDEGEIERRPVAWFELADA